MNEARPREARPPGGGGRGGEVAVAEVATVVVAAMAASEEATKTCRNERFASRNRQPKLGRAGFEPAKA